MSMKQWGIGIAGLVLAGFLFSGCSSEHYTADIHEEYEEEAFERVQTCFEEKGVETESATFSLLAPDGVTMTVTGRFFKDGMPVQYVYDANTDTLWASHTETGYCYRDAVSYLEQQISWYLTGTCFYDLKITSVSWLLPYKEYLYEVSSRDGEKSVSKASPKTRTSWLHRPFFVWDMSDEEIEVFLDEVLHGASDEVSAFCLDIFCDSFDFSEVQQELREYKIMASFSGISQMRVYEAADRGRYYLLEKDSVGDITVTYHESVVSNDGTVRWKSSSSVFSD